MLNKVKNGVIKQLAHSFGPEYEIYAKPVEQEVKAPCFFVTWRKTKEEHIRGTLYFRTYTFDVDYLTSETSLSDEAISELLFNALEYIEIDEMPVQGREAESDAALIPATFSIAYKLQIEKRKPAPEIMETLHQTLLTKG